MESMIDATTLVTGILVFLARVFGVTTVKSVEPTAFYSTEMTGHIEKTIRPIMQPTTGWRATMKKK